MVLDQHPSCQPYRCRVENGVDTAQITIGCGLRRESVFDEEATPLHTQTIALRSASPLLVGAWSDCSTYAATARC